MAKVFAFIFAMTIMFSSAVHTSADELSTGSKIITLTDAVKEAMQSNPLIRAEANGLKATEKDAGIAKSYLMPKLYIEEKFLRTDNPTYAFSLKLNQKRFAADDLMGAPQTFNNPEAINNFESSLNIEMPVFAKKAWTGLRMAKKELEVKQLDFSVKRQDIAYQVFKAYLGVQTAKAYLNTATEAVDDAREHLRIAELRYKSGVGLLSDTLRAKVAFSEAEQNYLKVQNDLEIAKSGLALVIGCNEGQSVDVSDETILLQDEPLKTAIVRSLQRDDIRAMQKRIENADNMVGLASSDYLPTIGLFAGYQVDDHRTMFGDEGRSWQVGAVLRWNIFDGLKRENEVAKAKAIKRQTEEYCDGLKKEISFKVNEAYLRLQEAKKTVELTKAVLASAEEAMRLINTRYQNSLSTMVDLLDAQVSLNTARSNMVKAENDYTDALGRLKYQAGSLLEDILKK